MQLSEYSTTAKRMPRPPSFVWWPASVVAALLSVAFVATGAQADSSGETKVVAKYGIAFAGVNIGHFGFKSSVGPKSYTLTSDSRVKAFFGLFKWSSQTKTTGVIAGDARPDSFSFDYWIKKKHKQSKITFSRGNAVEVTNKPRVNPSSKYVALTPEHLRGVIDPLTAIMRMTTGTDGQVCRQSAEIFDGRRRLRLVLSPKGRRKIEERGKSGQPRFGYVCRVQFQPIAGHKKSSQINYVADNKNIEIVLRPIPSEGLLVPYKILIPTSFGTVSVDARSINITTPRNQRIAMRF